MAARQGCVLGDQGDPAGDPASAPSAPWRAGRGTDSSTWLMYLSRSSQASRHVDLGLKVGRADGSPAEQDRAVAGSGPGPMNRRTERRGSMTGLHSSGTLIRHGDGFRCLPTASSMRLRRSSTRTSHLRRKVPGQV